MNGLPEFSPYLLRAAAALNARHRNPEITGVLLKSGGGFACLQVWDNLGDSPLPTHLASLASPRPTPLAARALAAAREDGAARRAGRSLFEGLVIPESHATLIVPATVENIEPWVALGFRTIKVKAGPDWPAAMENLARAGEAFPLLHWRFDFNGSLTPGGYLEWARALPKSMVEKIDFIEDPTPFHAEIWRSLESAAGIPLAADASCMDSRAAGFIGVCKPTRDDPRSVMSHALATGRRLVVTSNMDHCLGIAWAALWAARFSEAGLLAGPCGLCTHLLFEPDAFSAAFGPPGPRFNAPGGTGLGFDHALEKVVWMH